MKKSLEIADFANNEFEKNNPTHIKLKKRKMTARSDRIIVVVLVSVICGIVIGAGFNLLTIILLK